MQKSLQSRVLTIRPDLKFAFKLSNFLSSLPLKSLLLLAQGFGGDAIVALKFGIVMKKPKLPPSGAICNRNMAFSEMDMPASVRSVQHTPQREVLLPERLSVHVGKPNGRHFKSSDGLDHTICQWKPPRGVNIKQKAGGTVYSPFHACKQCGIEVSRGAWWEFACPVHKKKAIPKRETSGRKAVRKANKLCKMPERLLASDPRVEDIEARELERQKTLVLIIYKFGHRT